MPDPPAPNASKEQSPLTPDTASVPAPPSGPSVVAWVNDLATIVAAAGRIAQLDGVDELTRAAVEFARDSLGIERVGLHLVESVEPHIIMRGTWGTNDLGCTTCERELAHTCTREDFESFQTLHERGELWEYRALDAHESDRRRLPWTREDRDWLAITPLIASPEILGVFYNDTAISRTPLDSRKQVNLALFAVTLAGLTHDKITCVSVERNHQSAPQISRFMQKVLAELEGEPQLSGVQLAQRFRVSPGHLARTFKAEVGSSLVEYRNRLRLERFFLAMQAGQGNLNEAALHAGFGSYAQFRRVHWQITGKAPSSHTPNGDGNKI